MDKQVQQAAEKYAKVSGLSIKKSEQIFKIFDEYLSSKYNGKLDDRIIAVTKQAVKDIDFITNESLKIALLELKVDLMEKMDEKFGFLDKKLDSRLASIDEKFDSKFTNLEDRIDRNEKFIVKLIIGIYAVQLGLIALLVRYIMLNS